MTGNPVVENFASTSKRGRMPCMQPVVIVQHPLAQCHLAAIRAVGTSSNEFRRHLNHLARILFLEATRELPVQEITVQTPLKQTVGSQLARPLVCVPILRAGLGLLDGILPLVPDAVVAHVGIRRNEETALPHAYYANLPANLSAADVFLLDPMLATGGSACEAARQLKEAGALRITMICVVTCPEGLAAMQLSHPDVAIVTAAIDSGLNEKCYIVPGLGDAGDRYFGT
ncbi:uracil phosphoribosyltransferase [Prosthecobacter sp.]|uniref:uracil phosphoribosyltransferase n=1 Tax=Prosthecobacter sp. TaxID=1965333 RepID=UPI002488FD79|nr:uracil phosphoribosyltransferase [Prosthecobacter sp.]MDI1314265.1 uracil phosphoribosyltransferase [Prosthecobacter sp.]